MEHRDRLGIAPRILPMADEPVRTEVRTEHGWLEFQEYFVHRHQQPTVREVRFRGIESRRATPEVVAVLAAAEAIVIAPSNPIVSIGPILALPGIRDVLAAARRRGVSVIAMSGIVGGKALKGPADRMLTSLGFESSALGVARLYRDVADVFVLDALDAAAVPEIEALGLRAVAVDTIMSDDEARARVGRAVLDLVGTIGG